MLGPAGRVQTVPSASVDGGMASAGRSMHLRRGLVAVRIVGLLLAVVLVSMVAAASASANTAVGFGSDDDNALGFGEDGASVPTEVNGLSGLTAVAVGEGIHGGFGLALETGGTVAAWGGNQHGELGDDASGLEIVKPTVSVKGLGKVQAITVVVQGVSWL